MDIEDFKDEKLKEQTEICIRECQNRGLSFIDIDVNLTDEDLQDLNHNRHFNWTFKGVNIHLFKAEDD